MTAPRRPIKRGPGKRMVDGKDFRLADEVRYVQRCAARHHGRIVTISQLILFSTETGDAWLLDKEDGLDPPLARDGDPEPVRRHEASWAGSRVAGDPACARCVQGDAGKVGSQRCTRDFSADATGLVSAASLQIDRGTGGAGRTDCAQADRIEASGR